MADAWSLVWIVGTLTVIVSILSKVIGFPDQMRKNYLRKSTEGVSSPLMVLLLVSYALWTLYGFLIGDWVVIAGMGVGVITTGIIIFQIIAYRKKR